MNQDILFPTPDFVFSLRVGGILQQGDRILLQCADGEYATIGGHVAGLETAAETLRREFREELCVDIEVDDLLCFCENFFELKGRLWHQICFFYRVRLTTPDSLPKTDTFHGFDDNGNERTNLDYCWVPLSDLQKDFPLYPNELIPHLLRQTKEVGYFCSNQL